MADRSIPITYGVVAILTMFVIHQIIVLLSKNSSMQKILSGKPVLVIDKQGINSFALKEMNMQVNDLLQAMRNAGYFSIEEIDYGLMETNGQLSVIAKKKLENKQQALPIPVIMDCKWNEDDAKRYDINKQKVFALLAKHHLKESTVRLFTVDSNNHILIQPTKRPYFTLDLQKGEELS
jgi:uncharacterized membrane protein YcaP (DUF421 family)